MELSCHCGNIRIEVATPSLLTTCNCSLCTRYMGIWGYYKPGEPKISIGEFGHHSYAWGDKTIDFIRCANCGCVTHYETRAHISPAKVAINFGLAREQIAGIPVRQFNGASAL